MEKLLEKYLKKRFGHNYVKIHYFEPNGGNCSTEYYSEESHYYKETININVWDVIAFLYCT